MGSDVLAFALASRAEGRFVTPQQFGAKGDGVTDDTAAFNAALAKLSSVRTSPPSNAGHGVGLLFVPKGKYLINGTITVASPLGLRIVGAGEFATSLVRTNDAGDMFDFQAYIGVSFEHIAFDHSTATDKATWTNRLFKLDGTGGGREFRLLFCSTKRFGRVISFTDGVGNQDTTRALGCTFRDFHTFLYARTTQGVGNAFMACSWAGATSVGFDVAGYQATRIEGGNVAMDGTFIRVAAASGYYNEAPFTLTGVKFEWTAANTLAGSVPKIIDINSNLVIFNMTMIDCALFGGSTPHADARWGRILWGRGKINIMGGRLDGKLELTSATVAKAMDASLIRLRDVKISDPAGWTFTGAAGTALPQVRLENCYTGVAGEMPIDITITKHRGAPLAGARHQWVFAHPTASDSYFGGGSTQSMFRKTYGQLLKVYNLDFFITLVGGGTGDRTLNVYADAAKTQLVGTATIPNGQAANNIINIPISGVNKTTDGLYFDFISPGGAATVVGYLVADVSVG